METYSHHMLLLIFFSLALTSSARLDPLVSWTGLPKAFHPNKDSSPELSNTPVPSNAPEPSTVPGPSPSFPPSDTPSNAQSEIEEPPKSTTHNLKDVDPNIKKICDSTDFPDLCLAMVGSTPHGKTDVPSILELAINAGNHFARFIFTMVKGLEGKPGMPNDILKDCEGSYETALDNFEKAREALPAKDIGTMNSMLSAVITNVGDCRDELTEELGSDAPLSSYAEKMGSMTSNCLAIASLMPQ